MPPVLLELRAQLVLWGLPVRPDPKARLAHKDLKETLVQPALLELLARREGLLAGRNFRTAAPSSCLLESAG